MVDDSVVVPLKDIQVDNRMDHIERLMVILDWKMKSLRNKVEGVVKVQWQHRKGILVIRLAYSSKGTLGSCWAVSFSVMDL